MNICFTISVSLIGSVCSRQASNLVMSFIRDFSALRVLSAPACLQEVLDLPHSFVESCRVWKFMAVRAFMDFLRKLFKTKAKHHVDLLSPCR